MNYFRFCVYEYFIYYIIHIILNYHACHKIVHTGCGLFFHENCLSMYNVNVEIEEEVGDGGIDEDENVSVPPSKIKFRCPAHECWTCSGGPPPMCRPALVGEDLDDDSPKKTSGKKRKKRKSGSSTSTSTMWGAKKERLFRCLDW